MFLKKRIVNNTLYWSIAENYREEGKMKQRIILNLGNTNKAREILKSNPKYSYFLYYVQKQLDFLFQIVMMIGVI